MDIAHFCIAGDLMQRAGDWDKLQTKMTCVVEGALRYTLDGEARIWDLEGCEKNIFGVKFEKRFVSSFSLPRKRATDKEKTVLDTRIADLDVDIKTTLGGKNWTIPPETLDHWCVLLKVDYDASVYSLGTIFITEDKLNKGKNRDQKTTIRAAAKSDINWILQDVPYTVGDSLTTFDNFNRFAVL